MVDTNLKNTWVEGQILDLIECVIQNPLVKDRDIEIQICEKMAYVVKIIKTMGYGNYDTKYFGKI